MFTLWQQDKAAGRDRNAWVVGQDKAAGRDRNARVVGGRGAVGSDTESSSPSQEEGEEQQVVDGQVIMNSS